MFAFFSISICNISTTIYMRLPRKLVPQKVTENKINNVLYHQHGQFIQVNLYDLTTSMVQVISIFLNDKKQ